jgi:hypothetical protein
MKNILIVFLSLLASSVFSQTIAIFQDPDYYELNQNVPGEECLDEVFNVTSILGTYGYNNILPINDILDFTTGLNGVDVLIMPDMEQGDFSSDLPPSQATAINDFVNNGGRVIVTGNTQSFVNSSGSILNDIFGYNLVVSNLGPGTSNTKQTALPCFSSLPGTFSNTSPVGNFVITGGLPPNATVLYSGNTVGQSTVVSFSEGIGDVIYLAWDFRQSIPGCRDENQDWNDVLNCTITSANFQPIPTLSQWGVISLFLMISIFSICKIKQHYFQMLVFQKNR